MYCNNCGKNFDNDSKFCPFCGAKVENEKATNLIVVENGILEHLEFLGYSIIKFENPTNTQRYLAKHPTKSNIIFEAISDLGVSFAIFFTLDDEKVKKHYEQALEMVNRMNNRTVLSSYSLADELKSFCCGAFYQGKYNKQHFGEFLELFLSDVQRRLIDEDYLKKYS